MCCRDPEGEGLHPGRGPGPGHLSQGRCVQEGGCGPADCALLPSQGCHCAGRHGKRICPDMPRRGSSRVRQEPREQMQQPPPDGKAYPYEYRLMIK